MGRALGYRDTLAGQIITAASAIFDGGEVRLQTLLARLVELDMWGKVVGQNVGCPISYSADEVARQREDLEMWEGDVVRRTRGLEELGVYEGWDGAVGMGEYEGMVRRLEGVRRRVLGDEG